MSRPNRSHPGNGGHPGRSGPRAVRSSRTLRFFCQARGRKRRQTSSLQGGNSLNTLSRMAAFVTVMALAVLVASRAMPANAAPVSLLINGVAANATVAVGTAVPVQSDYMDDATNANFVLTSIPASSAVGYFSTWVITANSDSQTITPIPATLATTLTVTDDADLTSESTTVLAFFLCVGPGTTTISYTQGGGTSARTRSRALAGPRLPFRSRRRPRRLEEL